MDNNEGELIMLKDGGSPGERRRRRLMLGLVLGLLVAAALVGSLFLFGRERAVTPVAGTSTPGLPSPTLTLVAAQVASPTQSASTRVIPVGVKTAVTELPTAVDTGVPLQTMPMPSATAQPLAAQTSTPVLQATVQPDGTLGATPTIVSVATPTSTLTSTPTRAAATDVPRITATERIPSAVPSAVGTVGR